MVTGGFPPQRATTGNSDSTSIPRHHHGKVKDKDDPYNSVYQLTHKHRETHGCVVSTVATDALVLKHQAISILSTD